jgi:hypothetical protein
VLGAAYGAFYGAVLGSLTALPEGGTFLGAMYGTVLGAVGGCVTGAVLLIVGNGLGWAPAAIMGGLVPSLLLIDLTIALVRLSSDGSRYAIAAEILFGVLGVLILSLIAIFLGCAVARALGTGRSGVPGVRKFVEVVDAIRGQQRADGSALSAEVTPAPAPAGRGSEPAPSLAGITNEPIAASPSESPASRPVVTPEARGARPAALITAAALLVLCLTPLGITPYYIARYSGDEANLSGAFLTHAPCEVAVWFTRDLRRPWSGC